MPRRGSRRPPAKRRRGNGASRVLVLLLFCAVCVPLAAPPGAAPASSAIQRAGVSSAAGAGGAHRGPSASAFSVNFTASALAPLSESFVASSVGGVQPITYTWSFGDGSHGTGANVTHNYSAPGPYSVSLEGVDASRQYAYYSATVNVSAPASSPIDLAWLLVGAFVAMVLGVVLGVWASRKTARGEAQLEEEGPEYPGEDLPQPARGSRALPPPPLPPAGASLPGPSGSVRLYSGPVPSEVRPSYPYSTGHPTAPPAATGPVVVSSTWRPTPLGAATRPPARPAPAPIPTGPVAPAAPAAPTPPEPPVVALRTQQPGPAPVVPPIPSSPEPSTPNLDKLRGISSDEQAPLIDAVRQLNTLRWSELEAEADAGPASQLVGALTSLDPLVRLLRRHLQDPDRARRLLRDIAQAWFVRARDSANATRSPPPPMFRSVFASSGGEDTPSLTDRMGAALGEITWRGLLRSAPVLLLVLLTFAVVESLTFVALYLSFHGTTLTPFESIVVPASVLGPPALVLCLYPVVEWAYQLWGRLRSKGASNSLHSVPSLRMASYLLVLGLAEVSRVVADVVSGALFGTPSSFLPNGQVNGVAVVAFLLLLGVTIFLGWVAVSAWSLGGSSRSRWTASLLYLAVFAIWAGTESRLLVALGEGATAAAVAQVQTLLTYVPAYVIVATFFVIMVFFAFTEPEWQRAHVASARFRGRVAQSFVDDLESHPSGANGVPLDRLSDLARGASAPKVAEALRALFAYDPDADRYVVLRWHDTGSDTLLSVHIRRDKGGSYYALDSESQGLGGSAGASPGSTSMGGVAGAAGNLDNVWARTDLVSADAWLTVLRAKRGQGRLSRPPSEVRDAPPYRALLDLLIAPSSNEARELFRKVGWTKPSGPMLLVSLLQAAQTEQPLTPEIETDGEYLEVELNRLTGHAEDAQPYLGPWDIPGWHVAREVALGASGSGISYRATPSGATPAAVPPSA